MPGVSIQTAVRVGPNAATSVETSQMFAVGYAARGPVNTAKFVTSLEEFKEIYGAYNNSYLYPVVESFFEEGGTRAYIARVADPAATIGTKTLSASGVGGASLITITANGPGSWSSAVTVEVVNPGTGGSDFIIKIYDGGTLIYSTGNCTTVAQAVGRINSSIKASRLVTATNIAGSAVTLPENSAAAALSTGTADNSANVTTAHHVTALDLFLESYGTGVVVATDVIHATMNAALATHANAKSRIAFMYGASDSTIAQAKTAGNDLASGVTNMEHVAYFYPWVYAPTSNAGVTRLIPPVGYAAAKRAVAHTQVGAHKPGAGLISVAQFVNGVALDIDKTNGDALDEAYVNAIRVINNTIRIYGARSASSDTSNFRYITSQDVVNQVVVEANRSLEDLIFSVIDGRNTVFAAVESKLFAILEPLRASGALFEAFDSNGKRIDFGYTVKCDSTLNPVSQLADGLIKARVGVRVSSVGDKIEVDIVKSNLTKSVV